MREAEEKTGRWKKRDYSVKHNVGCLYFMFIFNSSFLLFISDSLIVVGKIHLDRGKGPLPKFQKLYTLVLWSCRCGFSMLGQFWG